MVLCKFREALSCGFEGLKLLAGAESNRGEEPVDVYNSRPLPFLIGKGESYRHHVRLGQLHGVFYLTP